MIPDPTFTAFSIFLVAQYFFVFALFTFAQYVLSLVQSRVPRLSNELDYKWWRLLLLYAAIALSSLFWVDLAPLLLMPSAFLLLYLLHETLNIFAVYSIARESVNG